jgi:hypothetical protein
MNWAGFPVSCALWRYRAETHTGSDMSEPPDGLGWQLSSFHELKGQARGTAAGVR